MLRLFGCHGCVCAGGERLWYVERYVAQLVHMKEEYKENEGIKKGVNYLVMARRCKDMLSYRKVTIRYGEEREGRRGEEESSKEIEMYRQYLCKQALSHAYRSYRSTNNPENYGSRCM